ncbi:MAG: YlxR family protein [Cyanobacterium sp. T60_A2020_053]|nr:YlxR family protein [Cyanobacterium sp. T60_A2020_053]
MKKNKNWRRCLSCGHYAPKDDFIRVVRIFPDHQIAINKGEGRSAYVCPNSDCINIARKKKRLGRCLRAPVSPAIYDDLQHILDK